MKEQSEMQSLFIYYTRTEYCNEKHMCGSAYAKSYKSHL
jgi:hypothetical protein